MTAVFPHDCAACEYLGTEEGADLYRCGESFVARTGAEPHEYRSLPAGYARRDPLLSRVADLQADPSERALRSALGTLAGGPPLSADYSERRGWCYALALRFIVECPDRLDVLGDHVKLVLCHGFPCLQTTGERYGHAWVEVEITSLIPTELRSQGWPTTITSSACYDPIIDQFVPTALYYRLGCIDPNYVARWSSLREVAQVMLDSGIIGNWSPFTSAYPGARWDTIDPLEDA